MVDKKGRPVGRISAIDYINIETIWSVHPCRNNNSCRLLVQLLLVLNPSAGGCSCCSCLLFYVALLSLFICITLYTFDI